MSLAPLLDGGRRVVGGDRRLVRDELAGVAQDVAVPGAGGRHRHGLATVCVVESVHGDPILLHRTVPRGLHLETTFAGRLPVAEASDERLGAFTGEVSLDRVRIRRISETGEGDSADDEARHEGGTSDDQQRAGVTLLVAHVYLP